MTGCLSARTRLRFAAGSMIAAMAATELTGASIAQPGQSAQPTGIETKGTDVMEHGFVGLWVTADGHIRHELLPGGRYDEQRGSRKSAYRGRYTISGNHIDYVDDTGFTADGDFVNGVLHHAGMVLYRERGAPPVEDAR